MKPSDIYQAKRFNVQNFLEATKTADLFDTYQAAVQRCDDAEAMAVRTKDRDAGYYLHRFIDQVGGLAFLLFNGILPISWTEADKALFRPTIERLVAMENFKPAILDQFEQRHD